MSGGEAAGVDWDTGGESFERFNEFCAASHIFPSFESSGTSMVLLVRNIVGKPLVG